MNKIGIYYAYWAHEWDVDFNPYVDKVAALGFDILEVNAGAVARLTSAERRMLIDHARQRNMELTYCIGMPAKYDVSSADETIRRNGIEFLKAQARGIGEMGGGKLSGIIYGGWPAEVPEGDFDRRPFLERSLRSMREAVKVAEDNNVIFNVEVVHRFLQFLLNTAEEALEYVKQVDSPNVKILLDTYHMNIEEDHLSTAIETAGSYLGHLHFGENNRRPPGYGHIDWDEVIGALKRINYTGGIVLEPFVMPGGQIGRDVRVWRDLTDKKDLDQEAYKALVFIRNLLTEE